VLAEAGPSGASAGTQSDIDSLLDQAQSALSSIDAPAAALPAGVKPFEFKDLSSTPAANETASLDLLRDVQLDLKIELGRTQMQLEDVLRLRQGAVVTLDKLAGDPVDVYANGRLIARGEVLVLNDNFCVRVAELIAGDDAV
jgi:flagellar motor switch protein FliN/FliY